IRRRPRCHHHSEVRIRRRDPARGQRPGRLAVHDRDRTDGGLARAVFAAHHMADAHERVCGLFLGRGGWPAERGAEGSWANLLFAAPRIVAAAATTGIASIDVPYFKPDVAGLEREATASRKLGMTGKGALHAEQLPAINTVFTPPPDAVT